MRAEQRVRGRKRVKRQTARPTQTPSRLEDRPVTIVTSSLSPYLTYFAEYTHGPRREHNTVPRPHVPLPAAGTRPPVTWQPVIG
ncbi:hypothetical protein BaRGS_00006526 [Batillaria attramentaria]|uniref:Uncharacterized protein n=1 Tax=Batillaria attramentaria TaxID=370345 RepID=A0ABD0LS50_9CAEN